MITVMISETTIIITTLHTTKKKEYECLVHHLNIFDSNSKIYYDHQIQSTIFLSPCQGTSSFSDKKVRSTFSCPGSDRDLTAYPLFHLLHLTTYCRKIYYNAV